MAQEIIMAQNIKCGGCVSRIREGLTALAGVSAVEVDIPTGQVSVSGDTLTRLQLTTKLAELGYPEKPR